MGKREEAEELVDSLGEPNVNDEPEVEQAVQDELPEETQEEETQEETEEGTQEEAPKLSIPKGRLDQETNKRRQVEEDFAKFKEDSQRREALLMEQLRRDRQRYMPEQEQQKRPPEPPKWEDDPDSWAKWMQQRNDQLEGHLRAFHQKSQANDTMAQVQAVASAKEEAFSEGHPDYYDALNFMRKQLAQEYRMSGIPAEQVPMLLKRVELETAAKVLQQQRDPAEFVYNLAQLRGYQPPKQEAEEETQQEAQQDSDELAMRRARNKAKSMGGGGRTKMPEDLEGSSDAEFEQAMKEAGFGEFLQ